MIGVTRGILCRDLPCSHQLRKDLKHSPRRAIEEEPEPSEDGRAMWTDGVLVDHQSTTKPLKYREREEREEREREREKS